MIIVNELALSDRLRAVALEIPIGSKIADIGSDHAYLPCFAALQGLISYAVAGEVNEGPFQSAKNQVEKLNLNDRIKVRKGNGLEVIEKDEINVITIAGMGGPLISEILEAGKDKLSGKERLILQPNIGAKSIRLWLIENGWELIKEHILEEDQKIYEILVAEKGNPHAPYSNEKREADLLLGPFLKKEKNEVFQKKWKHELLKWKKIIGQIDQKAQNEDTVEKRKDLMNKIQMVEEVLNDEIS
ncbi:putative SAM-dependent methyltransferase [Schinkia azotoformans MEV2011]|uniref:Putative SAM-dependent methyltransferase n=1 Tax=Schinkia azotoformans MEV2011 TaxID=1348973 RepID=A0A072NDZ1_SCHAZ|nr:putative SAM-dependent methyltransferase [Schinkia azotoformans MEV2011]